MGAGPAPSPFAVGFDAAAVPRIRSQGLSGEEAEFGSTAWLDRLAADPGTLSTSDGDPTRISYPRDDDTLNPEFAEAAAPYRPAHARAGRYLMRSQRVHGRVAAKWSGSDVGSTCRDHTWRRALRRVTVSRMVAVVCALVPLMGIPVAHAAPAELAPPATTAAQTTAQTPYAQQSGESGEAPPWGLLGLTGLLGLVGLARKRRRPVVADPLSPYPAMRATGVAQRRDPHTSPHGMSAGRGPQPAQPQPTSSPQASPRPRPAQPQPGGASGNAGAPRGLAAHTPPAIPAQNRGGHERLRTAPRPVPAPRSAAAPSDLSPTSVTSDGNIRLAPAPPLHANRLSPPNLDISGIPGMADAPPAEPRWPQREYD